LTTEITRAINWKPGGAGWILVLALAAALAQGAPELAYSTPATDPKDLTIWPNQTSRANSDRWLVENHDRLRRMQPRLLVLNFSNEARRDKMDRMLADLIGAMAEGSRYHGYKDSNAPAFLQYRALKFVDLRDAANSKGNSAKFPLKPGVTNGFNVEYNRFFGEEFAGYYGVFDPRQPGRSLRLEELVDLGYVHEVWFFCEHIKGYNPFEVVELKPVYDESFARQGNRFVQAGNGGDPEQKWTGRSVRIGFINASRGIGCYIESMSHGIEGNANCRAIPYFTKYFYEFAGLDLRKQFPGFPHRSFYSLPMGGGSIEYPDPSTALVRIKEQTWALTNYVAFGGNVHFMPNGRRHYDLDNQQPVMSTIEDWRIGSGPGGRDLAKPWTSAAFDSYRKMAPDCMGAWLVYWRQNFPGLDNRQKDDAGKPMKNWWPFLFY
jgi:hypothetical protein